MIDRPMNAERLLAHYEKIADAPDAIARLRRFVLDLAVRGKLVSQDADDEPAEELLKRIAKEKARLVKAGEIRKEKPLTPMGDDTDFDIPPTWRWTRLGVITSYIQRGKSPKYAAADGSLVVSQKCVQWRGLDLSAAKKVTLESLADYEDIRFLRDGDLLWNSTGTGTIGRVIRLLDPPEKLVCDSHVTVVRCLEVDPEYIRSWLLSDHVYALIEDRAAGSTNQVELTAQMAINQVVPLPPLAEQHRIVAKVDELMGRCDRLEAARAGREAVRDKLTAASLARLNAPDPETFEADARFALDALPALTTRPDQIKALRQTILNLAVRGKLVPQDANDEPAAELLKRIAKEKARLVKEGKVKRQNALPEIDLDQVPFELPAGWAWGRFPEVGTFGRGRSKHRPRNDPALFDRGEHLMIQTGDVARSQGVIETYTNKYNDFGLSQSFKWPKGTLCITIAANIADSGILSFDACFPDSVVGFIPAPMFENARYFEYFVRTAKATLLEFAPATAQKNINLEILTQVLIPLPPLAEQYRIVAKVDALMALCDRLEASLTATAATRCRLLEALLTEALTPSEDRDAFFDASPDAKPVPTFAGDASEAAE
ncbi:restriction endonuclease subunit S [Enterovirga rhinocerotis]|uniref:Type I restriction enzyme S subunit n=1 Tax=Enterovirga rhinocerotis TaxID=1339210 RepID=A0A4R7C560_9HYPH|nr:restriction endonuclease subunit S [Enterovirga rhinocerotis]TDR93002.1 type I restriction enzyme S subunit [Enterovirga rhinocerotis]